MPDTSGDDFSPPSKTQLKQRMQELQSLGAALAELGDERIDAIPMPDALREAVATLKRTRSHEGRRRQLQYVGKLMRQADAAPIHEAIAAARVGLARDALALHACEAWRDALIAHDDALTRWSQAHPDGDLQQLRSLIRAARRDAETTPPPAAPGAPARKGRAFRELFRFLQQHGGEALP
jgi:ribosome-associated protein